MSITLTQEQKIDLLEHIESGHNLLSLARSPVSYIDAAFQLEKEKLITMESTTKCHGWELQFTEKGKQWLHGRKEVVAQYIPVPEQPNNKLQKGVI